MRAHTSRLSAAPALLLLMLAAAGIRSAAAQATPARSAGEEGAVMATVRALFDAMRSGDSAAVRATFHPAAQLATALVRDGKPDVQLDSVAVFARAVGTPHAEVWDERVKRTTVHIDGPLAVVWAEYAFYAGPRFSHCGVDAFQLVKTAAGWRILALTDTRQRTGCHEQAASRR